MNERRELAQRSRLLDRLAPVLVDKVLPRLDRRREQSVRPFDRAQIMRPELNSRIWAWTHYGFFVPDLPAPYRYVNTMTLIGNTGTVIFDNDVLSASDVRRNSTVLSSTAAGTHHHYRSYDGESECTFAADGSRLTWNDDLDISCAHPGYHVRGDYADFAVDLRFTATEHVSYFVKTPVYEHFSLLAPYRGTLTPADGEPVEVSGLGTVEYARCFTPQVFTAAPVGPALRLPIDFFTYQIVPIDQQTQLLLTDVRANGASACRLAQTRSTSPGNAQVNDDVVFTVLEYQDEDLVDPLGVPMRVPSVMRWDVAGRGHLLADVDAPLRPGHGRGFVGAFSFTGRWDGRPVAGSAYLEWIDCEVRA